MDRLVVREGASALVEALLGDVRVVGSIAEAVAAHDACPGCTYVTPEGVAALSDGRVVLGVGEGAERGSLDRKRRIRTLREGMDVLESDLAQATERVATRDRDLADVRDRNARAKGDVARLQGELSSVTSEIGRLEGQRTSSKAEAERVGRQRAEAASKAEDARSAIERHRVAAEKAAAEAEELSARVESLADERNEASRTESDTDRKLSDARLRLATVQERKNNLIMRKDDLTARLRRLEKTAQSASHDVAELSAKIVRVEPLQRDEHDLNTQRMLDLMAAGDGGLPVGVRYRYRADLEVVDEAYLYARSEEVPDVCASDHEEPLQPLPRRLLWAVAENPYRVQHRRDEVPERDDSDEVPDCV
jgi:chromosome segregation protein